MDTLLSRPAAARACGSPSRAPKRSRRASVALEFAVSLPVLVVLAAGLVDLGDFFVKEASISHVARSATRGAVAADDPEAMADTLARRFLVEVGLDGEGAVVDATLGTEAGVPQQVLVVRIELSRGRPLSLVGAPDTLRAVATMAVPE